MENLSEHYVAEAGEILEYMMIGNQNRVIGETKMNAHSSRSHSVLILNVTSTNTLSKQSKTANLYLVDLAGSETIAKTQLIAKKSNWRYTGRG